VSERSGVSLPTVRRYERSGRTSLQNLLKLCHALGRLDEFAGLMAPPPASSLADLESRAAIATPARKRGKR
jgi:transcriptional regulator with XRE-family HTH domain